MTRLFRDLVDRKRLDPLENDVATVNVVLQFSHSSFIIFYLFLHYLISECQLLSHILGTSNFLVNLATSLTSPLTQN